MKLVISPAEAGDDQALVSLYKWLSRDSAVASCGQVTVASASPTRGGMGAAFDVINAVFSDAGAAAGVGSLLVAYRAWRTTRTQAPTFKIEKDGVTVTLDQATEQDVQRILDVMLPDR